MGLVKTRRLAAMHKQQRAKATMKPPMKGNPRAAHPWLKRLERRNEQRSIPEYIQVALEVVDGVSLYIG